MMLVCCVVVALANQLIQLVSASKRLAEENVFVTR